ncbi:MAG TPA: glycosyl hydrolase 108 family protein [Sphingomonas sp.]
MADPSRPAQEARNGKRAAIASAIAAILCGLYAVEGGYVNDPSDPGGATNHGVTEKVARANGYRGDMRAFPKHCDGPAAACADRVYVRQYIAAPGYMAMIKIEPAVAQELVDTAVNMGPARENRWFRQTVNGLAPARLPESGAALGPADIDAYRMVQARLGRTGACIAVLDGLDQRQASEYRRIARVRPASAKYLKGWLKNRIGNVDRTTCGKDPG